MMIEQPLAQDEIYRPRRAARETETPICLDECIRDLEHAAQAIALGACKIINIKLGRVGGFTRGAPHSRRLRRRAAFRCGAAACSSPASAARTTSRSPRCPNFTLPGDVSASKRYWVEDIIDPEVIVSSRGTIAVPTAPGIGYNVKMDLIEKLTTRTEKLA